MLLPPYEPRLDDVPLYEPELEPLETEPPRDVDVVPDDTEPVLREPPVVPVDVLFWRKLLPPPATVVVPRLVPPFVAGRVEPPTVRPLG